jgi:thioredoxin reductase (NADPH)
MDVPGEELPKVRHYYNDPHPYVGKKVLVVGAANSACDVALETWQKGAEVSMAIRGDSISPRVKYWIKPNIENRIKEGSITAYFHTEVQEIREEEVLLKGPEGSFSIPNDFVLAMTGYQPNFAFLKKLNLKIEGEECIPHHHPENLRTNLPNVYMAGVVCGGMKTSTYFIENTRDHGDIIIDQVLEALDRAPVAEEG